MKTVVVIDDEYAIVETLVDVLELHGYACVTAANGREGLDYIEQRRPDLVVTDLMMPIMDGRELIDTLRGDERYKTLPIILVSAAQSVSEQNSAQDPWLVCLRKPFSVSELLFHIRKLTGGE